MLRRSLLLLTLLILAGCGGRTATPTAPPETPGITPSSSLTAAALEAAIFSEGDLPANYEAGTPLEPEPISNAPEAQLAIARPIESPRGATGRVSVWVFADEAMAQQALEAHRPAESQPLSGVGDEAFLVPAAGEPERLGLVWRRCAAVASVTFQVDQLPAGRGQDTQLIEAYAKRIDRRLEPLACQ